MTHSIFDTDLTLDRKRSGASPHRPQAGFGYDVDGSTYEHDQPTITGAQLMFEVSLYPRQALIRILNDGSRLSVTAAETLNLSSGAHFKRRPRFKRG
jgi:hypothetical protein